MFNMTIGSKKQAGENPENPTFTPIAEKQEQPSQPEKKPELDSQPDLHTSSPETEASHFDELINEAENVEQERELAAVSSTMLTQDQFRQSFIGLHGMAATFSGIQSIALPNSRIDGATANEVADMFYETILDVPMLHFMLQPGNKWLGRALVMTVYVQGMRGAVLAEIAEKRAASGKADFAKAKKATAKPTKTHDSGELTPDQAAALTGA
jgi:hypothetical protein